MPWTEDLPLFRQTMFKVDENDLAEADKLVIKVVQMLAHERSSSSTALATFVTLIADFIAANVDPDRLGRGSQRNGSTG
jgi:hypothetical protein